MPNENYYCFYGKHPFSHVTPCSFAVDGSNYYCIDQFVKLSMLRAIGMHKIVHQLRTFSTHKNFLRSYASHVNKLKADKLVEVKVINDWYTRNLKLCLKKAYRQLFLQNVTFKAKLLSTGEKCIVYAQLNEKLMGVNMSEAQFYIWVDANHISPPQLLACFGDRTVRPPYLGANLIGVILMELRNEFAGLPAFKLPKMAEVKQAVATAAGTEAQQPTTSASDGKAQQAPTPSGASRPASANETDRTDATVAKPKQKAQKPRKPRNETPSEKQASKKKDDKKETAHSNEASSHQNVDSAVVAPVDSKWEEKAKTDDENSERSTEGVELPAASTDQAENEVSERDPLTQNDAAAQAAFLSGLSRTVVSKGEDDFVIKRAVPAEDIATEETETKRVVAPWKQGGSMSESLRKMMEEDAGKFGCVVLGGTRSIFADTRTIQLGDTPSVTVTADEPAEKEQPVGRDSELAPAEPVAKDPVVEQPILDKPLLDVDDAELGTFDETKPEEVAAGKPKEKKQKRRRKEKLPGEPTKKKKKKDTENVLEGKAKDSKKKSDKKAGKLAAEKLQKLEKVVPQENMEDLLALQSLLSGLLVDSDLADLAASCSAPNALDFDYVNSGNAENGNETKKKHKKAKEKSKEKVKKKKKIKEKSENKKPKSGLKSVVSEVNFLMNERRILYSKQDSDASRLQSAVVRIIHDNYRDRRRDRSRSRDGMKRRRRSRSRSRRRRSHSRSHRHLSSKRESIVPSPDASDNETRDGPVNMLEMSHYAVHTAPVWSCLQDLVDNVVKEVEGVDDEQSTRDDIKSRSICHMATLQRIKAMNFKYARQRSLRSCTPRFSLASRRLADMLDAELNRQKRSTSLGPAQAARRTTRFGDKISPIGEDINELLRKKPIRNPQRRPVTYQLEPGEVPPPWWVPPPAPAEGDPQYSVTSTSRSSSEAGALRGDLQAPDRMKSLLQSLVERQEAYRNVHRRIHGSDPVHHAPVEEPTQQLNSQNSGDFEIFPRSQRQPLLDEDYLMEDQYESSFLAAAAAHIPWMSGNAYRGEAGSLMPRYVFGSKDAKEKKTKHRLKVSAAEKMRQLKYYAGRWLKGSHLSTMARMGLADEPEPEAGTSGQADAPRYTVTGEMDTELALLRAVYEGEEAAADLLAAKIKEIDPKTVEWSRAGDAETDLPLGKASTGVVYVDTSDCAEWLSWYRQTHDQVETLPETATEDSAFMPSGKHKEELRSWFKGYRTRLEDLQELDPRFRDSVGLKSAAEVGISAPVLPSDQGVTRDGGRSFEAMPIKYNKPAVAIGPQFPPR